MVNNAHITVITSKELTAMRLDDLVGCRGLVVEVLSEDRIKNKFTERKTRNYKS